MPVNFKDVRIKVLKKIEVSDVHKKYAAEGIPSVCKKYNEG
jgi:hypothetical protein